MRFLVHFTPRRLVVGAGALALLAAGAAGAYAAANGTGGVGRGAIVSAVTSELGISGGQLGSDLASGQTLSQIATANGKSVSDLEQTILTAVQSRLDQAVAAGKLTEQQEQTLLTRAGTVVDRLVDVSHPIAHLRLSRLRVGLVRLAAQYVGVTPKQLRSEIAAGTPLAQIVTSNGKTVDGLEQALATALKNRLDAAVTAGKITATQEQALLSRLQTRLGRLLGSSSTTSN
jgi:hypothetical protein